MKDLDNKQLEERQLFEGSECAVCNRLVVSNKIEWKDESKYTLFNRKNSLWTCENYLADGPYPCTFAMCHQCVTDLMIVEAPKNEKDGSFR